MNDPRKKRVNIGSDLLQHGLVSDAQLEEALAEQKRSGVRLGKILVQLGFVTETEILKSLSRQLNYPFMELRQFHFDRELIARLPEVVARRYRVLLLKEDTDGYNLGMADATDIMCLDEISGYLDRPIQPVVVSEQELMEILDIAYSQADQIASLAAELGGDLEDSGLVLDDIVTDATESDAPVVRLLQKIFEEAISNRASDIHIEPDEGVLRIRQRVDGMLSEQLMNDKRIVSALVVRLKLMAGLNISEKRLPQDGRFNLKVKGRNIDVRMSTMPIQFGESVVMRLLDHTEGVLSLSRIGMPSVVERRFRQLIERPHGLLLVTGPTGSGKTTTLYGALEELNTSHRKIITVEDPVEYRLPRINQVQVNERIGLSFAAILRATLRQDPEILLVGEIRDGDSAEIALRAAMTGHMVLSTLHTNDAVTSALRLIDMNVDPYLVAASLKAVISQRLIRRVCDACAEPYAPDPSEMLLVRHLPREQLAGLRQGGGCPRCMSTGYRGRIGVFELLEINQDMANALREKSVRQFNEAALHSRGYTPLNASALQFALDGVTTLAEVQRVSALVEDESIDEPEAVAEDAD